MNLFFYCFLITMFFIVFFLFDNNTVKSLNHLKNCNHYIFLNFFVISLLLSLAGIPPFLGFIIKFSFFYYLIIVSNIEFIIFFAFVNFFIVYFYIQNIKLLISDDIFFGYYFNKNYNYINQKLVYILIYGCFLNFFSFFFFNDALNYFYYLGLIQILT